MATEVNFIKALSLLEGILSLLEVLPAQQNLITNFATQSCFYCVVKSGKTLKCSQSGKRS